MEKIAISKLVEKTNQAAPVLKKIHFTACDGEEYEADVWVGKMRFADNANLTEVYKVESIDDKTGEPSYSTDNTKLQAARILSCVYQDENGTPLFESLDQVMEADHGLTTAIFVACDEVNSFLGKYLKSGLKTKSGTNSPSAESAETPLSKSNEKLPSKNSTHGVPTDENMAASTSDDA